MKSTEVDAKIKRKGFLYRNQHADGREGSSLVLACLSPLCVIVVNIPAPTRTEDQHHPKSPIQPSPTPAKKGRSGRLWCLGTRGHRLVLVPDDVQQHRPQTIVGFVGLVDCCFLFVCCFSFQISVPSLSPLYLSLFVVANHHRILSASTCPYSP